MKTIPIFLAFVQLGFCALPKEVLTAYKNALQAGDLDQAWELHVKRKDLPASLVAEEREIFNRNAGRTVEAWNFEILAELSEEDCAVFAVNEATKDGQPAFDLDPVFLIKQNGSWKVCENAADFKNIDPEKKAALDKLQMWFKGFKQGVKWWQIREVEAK